MDDGFKALVGFIGAHGDSLEFLEFAKEVLDEVPPFVELASSGRGNARLGCCEMTILAPRSFRPAIIRLLSNALSAINPSKARPSMSGATPAVSKTMAGQKNEEHEIAERIGEGGYSGRHAALGAADGPAFESPFCALAVAVDLDDGGIDHGLLHVRRLRTGLEKPHENIGFDPIAISLEDGVPVAEKGRYISRRASSPHDPEHCFDKTAIVAPASVRGSAGLPKQCGSSLPIGRPSAQIVPSKA